MAEQQLRHLDFYGFRVILRWPEDLKLDQIQSEFTYFNSKEEFSNSDCEIVVERQKVEINDYPFLRPAYYTPRNICYVHDGEKIINYHGKALVIQSRDNKTFRLIGEDSDLLQSIAYTVIIARTGHHFDSIKRFRVHALGFSFREKAYLVLLPIGGGKSTLLLNLLKHPEVKLLSEDTPLISADGMIHPCPVKLGVLPGGVPKEIPQEYITRVRHIEGVEKDVIHLAYFGGQIANAPSRVHAIFIGERFLGKGVDIVPLSFVQAYRKFFRDCVVGIGVYQGLEFLLNAPSFEVLRSAFVGLQRSSACMRFVLGAKRYEFRMGTDLDVNADALISFLEEHEGLERE